LLFILTLLTSCTGVKITNNWDKDVDFSTFKTYSLYPWDRHNDQVLNDYDKQTILTSIKNEMNKRGYRHVEKNGDLIISTFVIIEEQTSYQAYTNHYGGWAGYGGGWYGNPAFYGYGWGTTTIYRTDYNQGTLIIDIFRLSDKILIWQGIGSGEVTDNYEKRDRRLPKNIAHIFRRFPQRPMSSKKMEERNAEMAN
jgi:hypothetical protein